MTWIIFSAMLSSKGSSKIRVSVWRRMQRLGAIAPHNNLWLLPNREECIEAFYWLAQEVRSQAEQAVVLHVSMINGLSDQQLIEQFQAARTLDYQELTQQLQQLEQHIDLTSSGHSAWQRDFGRIRRRYADIRQIDYFVNPQGLELAQQLADLQRLLACQMVERPMIETTLLDQYQTVEWATRPRPHVDRLACAWFIRRFINPSAVIHYRLMDQSNAVLFDTPDADFGHVGNQCSFETMIQRFQLNDPALRTMAEIIHDIDLHENDYNHAETIGVSAVLQGWRQLDLTDEQREIQGLAFFDGLYSALQQRLN